MIATKPLWSDPRFDPVFKPLEVDIAADVAIVGAGITGLTAAYLLERAGKRVVVLEARQVLSGVTGSTTSHLTQLVDTRYHELEKKFGREGAKGVASSSAAAIDLIERIVREQALECGFERVPGYLFAETSEQAAELELELAAAIRSGLSATASATAPLPFEVKAAMRVENQAQLDPRAYLAPIAVALNANGSSIFTQSPVVSITESDTCTLETPNGAKVRAPFVLVATHSPLNVLLLQTKIAHYQSYVVSGPVTTPLHALLNDMGDPYHYIRTQLTRAGLQLIIGGEDHKTGQEKDTEAAFERLTAYARRFHMVPDHRWSAQVIEPVDGLPFIGRNSGSKNVFVATGFSGNGTTFGTLAAMLFADAVMGKPNPWGSLYEATRIKPLASLPSYIAENVDFPLYLAGGALKPAEAHSVNEVGVGEGKIVAVGGKRAAVFRDVQGKLHGVSSVCTHMACRVAFNSAQTSWDCPCHGSRFSVDGEVLDGPAVTPLERIDLGTAG